MANEILTYESNAWMAVATYEDLTSVIGKLNDPTYINILKNSKDFTQSQAEEFAKRYRVDYQYSDNITGFGATLFWDTESD